MTVLTTNKIDSHLVSYAFLKADSDDNRDYYDYFVPFIKEILVKHLEIIVTANNIQIALKEEFKIDLPIKVIETILKRFNKQKILYRDNNALKVNRKSIENSNFSARKQQILVQHSMLIESFIKYADENYNVKYDPKIAEEAINDLINQNPLVFLKEIEMKNEDDLFLYMKDTTKALITAKFIEYILKNNPSMYNHLLEIVKGQMLLKAIYMVDGENLDRFKMKFEKTEIYFDTTFLLFALGHSGPELQNPCLELLELLRSSNTILRCFAHNIDEARGILEFCQRNINNPGMDSHGTISNFIEKGLDDSDIDELIFDLETSISEKLKLDIVNEVPYRDHAFVIDEFEITNHLNDRIKYKSKRALERDVESVSAICRLRRGNRTVYIEQCKALFVTTNYHLAKYTREYFSDENEPKIITPIIHDSLLMNLVWLKNPQLSPNLPSSILMADCYAAGLPSEKLWSKYFSILDTLKDSEQISEEKVMLLKYSQGIKALVMNETLGDDELMTVGSVNSILKKIEDKQEMEKQQAIMSEKQQWHEKVDKMSSEIESSNITVGEQAATIEEIRNRNSQFIYKLASRKARLLKTITALVLYLLMSAIIIRISLQMFTYSSIQQIIYTLLITAIPILLGLLGVTPLKKPLKKLEIKLTLYYEKKLINESEKKSLK
ncbi:hypothetical protein SporoP37_16515 (plasmid) [Sporosarcina sp. P37]|uniref:hypothetical protein n=1 Tax=unclassified Sporosarcina TaxID=2647733 RepID=UPI000A17B773|nr:MULTISPECIES: hypothetical protein [unclassified Sporosarcina]ARK26382.1 hypothetical protein SporoP37_16515 [Sporosarcina sp. P37]PID17613.1 hypothetical protein CSV62_12480 [Sporosarcina sp. P35]